MHHLKNKHNPPRRLKSTAIGNHRTFGLKFDAYKNEWNVFKVSTKLFAWLIGRGFKNIFFSNISVMIVASVIKIWHIL